MDQTIGQGMGWYASIRRSPGTSRRIWLDRFVRYLGVVQLRSRDEQTVANSEDAQEALLTFAFANIRDPNTKTATAIVRSWSMAVCPVSGIRRAAGSQHTEFWPNPPIQQFCQFHQRSSLVRITVFPLQITGSLPATPDSLSGKANVV